VFNTLRIEVGDVALAQLSFLDADGRILEAACPFSFVWSAQDQEDLRWYLEDYLDYPGEPAPRIAARIEQRLSDAGIELFKTIFDKTDETRAVWNTAKHRLHETRVEISTRLRDTASVPWELIRDPQTDRPVSLVAAAFVRSHRNPTRQPAIPEPRRKPVRILLAICRPRAGDDVPFRSVASRLLRGLNLEATREDFRLDLLRPPTFEQLGKVLRHAHAGGEPYHIVHFDGHGANRRLFFENPDTQNNSEPIDGGKVGDLLWQTGVSTLVLNACRSAHAEPPLRPDVVIDEHAEIRAFGSVAHEAVDLGVASVVAMRFNVFVETAGYFMRDLYEGVARGNSLGEAVSAARKQLELQPMRQVGFDPVELKDWIVPVVFENAPVRLLERDETEVSLELDLTRDLQRQDAIDAAMPRRPDAGFFGRDETLLALDRAFDAQSVALLHAYAGSGKTSAAAEFARWYSLTGGIKGLVLFTSFERKIVLADLLDQFALRFETILERSRIHWATLKQPGERRNIVLAVMKKIPVFWIWDNVEPVAGFPAGADSPWSKEEQKELADFLRDAANTTAKFVITSRRDERKWLQDLPVRIEVPPMPFQESVQLARALVEKRGRKLSEVADWRPLLRFTQGNPLTITVMVGEAMRQNLSTAEQIENFVRMLEAGQADIREEVDQGRPRSLTASLSYGLEHAFNELERTRLSLLRFYQGFVDAASFVALRQSKYALPELAGQDRDHAIRLFDRAAELGLLAPLGHGVYRIHPAVPWFFDREYRNRFAGRESRATEAFVATMGFVATQLQEVYTTRGGAGIGYLEMHEANFLYALRLAIENESWFWLTGILSALESLYGHSLRKVEWERLIRDTAPNFIDPATNRPLTGRELAWSFIVKWQVDIARRYRRYDEAERLQRLRVDFDRKTCAEYLAREFKSLKPSEVERLHSFAVSTDLLGTILQDRQSPTCLEFFQESIDLSRRIGDRQMEALVEQHLGYAYRDLEEIQDYDASIHHFLRCVELLPSEDRVMRGKCYRELGNLDLMRLHKNLVTGGDELFEAIRRGITFFLAALKELPEHAVDDRGHAHFSYGGLLHLGKMFDEAFAQYKEALKLAQRAQNENLFAGCCFNIASVLKDKSQFADAREYAKTALASYQSLQANDRAVEALQLLLQIEQAAKSAGQASS
jgi:tetratricopeptide (TPR) repeat protein